MATLAQLKRDADSGRMSVMLLWRFGKTGNDIPREMRGVRKVFRANSVGLVLEFNGKESTLYTDSAKLVEYDGKTLTFYRAGYRSPTAEERFVLNTWKTMEDEYIKKNPFGDCFGKRKAYFLPLPVPGWTASTRFGESVIALKRIRFWISLFGAK